MKTFYKKDNPEKWPFADGETVEVIKADMCLIATIGGVQYAMNGLAIMRLKLPEVRILEGKSVAPYIKEALR